MNMTLTQVDVSSFSSAKERSRACIFAVLSQGCSVLAGAAFCTEPTNDTSSSLGEVQTSVPQNGIRRRPLCLILDSPHQTRSYAQWRRITLVDGARSECCSNAA
ncbi:hypothetical protein PsYK624_088670 [Phanerochaete sordida]|uniref:Uncharacterized protein n=1 Tax=Phanerochaete sordida TaxID=48140 RepID=A0A9P3LEN4_9APHY|nr:hypothetical protein PsYK624_088670 [Phanerochaete sordida]